MGGGGDAGDIGQRLSQNARRLVEGLQCKHVAGFRGLGHLAVGGGLGCGVVLCADFQIVVENAARRGIAFQTAFASAAAGSSVGLHNHVADFARHTVEAVHKFSVAENAAANPGAERDAEKVVGIPRLSVNPFTHGGGVGIVVHHYGNAGKILSQFVFERNLLLEFQIGGMAQNAGPRIHVGATHAYALDFASAHLGHAQNRVGNGNHQIARLCKRGGIQFFVVQHFSRSVHGSDLRMGSPYIHSTIHSDVLESQLFCKSKKTLDFPRVGLF